jgi:hypothetical protein
MIVRLRSKLGGATALRASTMRPLDRVGVASCDATPTRARSPSPASAATSATFGQGHVLVSLSFEDAATIHGASITHIAVAKQIFARRSKYFQLVAAAL